MAATQTAPSKGRPSTPTSLQDLRSPTPGINRPDVSPGHVLSDDWDVATCDSMVATSVIECSLPSAMPRISNLRGARGPAPPYMRTTSKLSVSSPEICESTCAGERGHEARGRGEGKVQKSSSDAR
eukprot:2174890-Rhodomonas_salina.3